MDGTVCIKKGAAVLGIELGSTRIKASLIDEEGVPLSSGSHEWENRREGGYWTYSLEDVKTGLRACYADLKSDVKSRYGVTLSCLKAIGVSAMMHGYMPFDREGNLLVPFRTWRNNTAARAAEELTGRLGFHIPARWSAAHLYQAILDGEEHVPHIAFQTTLEGYVHLLLTGEKVIGVGEASGMFPVDARTCDYDSRAEQIFNTLLKGNGLPFRLRDIFPRVLSAGMEAGRLTEEGARFLDPEGDLRAGIPFCPPEGDAGTGMAATNAVSPRTGNVSAGTSVFAMIVLERPLKKVYPEIDVVATPAGAPVAMVHCNNCSSELNAWAEVFLEFAERLGKKLSKDELFSLLFSAADRGEKDCGGLVAYNFVSNEQIAKVEHGRPLFVRTADDRLTFDNFMRAQLCSAFASLKTGCDILFREENAKLDKITAHGGLFRTERVAQSVLAAAIGAPVTVLKTAGEGGAWGMALLANYLGRKESLESYLSHLFAGNEGSTLSPDSADAEGFERFHERFTEGLPVVREAVRSLK